MKSKEVIRMVKNKIKQLRMAKRMSQEQLAEKAQVSVRTIQRLEAGEDASISTLNLVAGALGVEVGDLFPTSNSEQQADKIQNAADQLHYQLDARHDEYHLFKKLFNAIYIICMLALGAVYFAVTGALRWVIVFLWVGGWIIMSPLKKWLVIQKINPKLDAKYPLTVNRVDKNGSD